MNEINKITIPLRSMMARDDAWGTEEGRAVYEQLSRFVKAHSQANVFVVSLAGVKRTDASFPRESVVELAKQFRTKIGFCLVDAANEDLLDNWDAAANKKEQPIFVWSSKGYRILGPQPSGGNAQALDFVVNRFETRAVDLVTTFSLKIANASMKLKQLWEEGFIFRREYVAGNRGIEYLYFPAR